MTGWCAPFGIQLVSVTNQFRFEVPDGKQRGSDALAAPIRRSRISASNPISKCQNDTLKCTLEQTSAVMLTVTNSIMS